MTKAFEKWWRNSKQPPIDGDAWYYGILKNLAWRAWKAGIKHARKP